MNGQTLSRVLSEEESSALKAKHRQDAFDRRSAIWGSEVAVRLAMVDGWSNHKESWPAAMPLLTRLELTKALLTLNAHEVERSHPGSHLAAIFRADSNGAAAMLECADEYGLDENFVDHLNAGRFSEKRVLAMLDKHADWFPKGSD